MVGLVRMTNLSFRLLCLESSSNADETGRVAVILPLPTLCKGLFILQTVWKVERVKWLRFPRFWYAIYIFLVTSWLFSVFQISHRNLPSLSICGLCITVQGTILWVNQLIYLEIQVTSVSVRIPASHCPKVSGFNFMESECCLCSYLIPIRKVRHLFYGRRVWRYPLKIFPALW